MDGVKSAGELGRWASRRIGLSTVASREDIERYQLSELRRAVDTARHARFYGDRLRDIASSELHSLDDLAKIPFTLPRDLSDNPLAFVLSPIDEVQRVVTIKTSGTSAPPKKVHFTDADIERTVEFFAHGMADISGENGRVIIFMPGNTPDGVGDILRRGLTRLGRECRAYGAISDYADAEASARGFGATCAVGLPYQMLSLARRYPDLRLGRVLLSADYIPRAAVRAIETAWDCRVFAHYGMTETVYGGAVECAYRTGLHVRDPDLLIEIADTHTGAAMPVGSFGEIVLTTLGRAGTALLRYKTGDYGRILPGKCPCGCELTRLDRAITRISGGVTLFGGVTLTISALDEALYAVPSLYGYDASVETRDGRDALVIRADTNGGEGEITAALGEIPDIARLISRGELTADVTRGARRASDGAVKRGIIDNRGASAK
jgi:phenylacetate-coenzyme A ligase PaaK-like adenylate-forming protein